MGFLKKLFGIEEENKPKKICVDCKVRESVNCIDLSGHTKDCEIINKCFYTENPKEECPDKDQCKFITVVLRCSKDCKFVPIDKEVK